MTVPQASRQPGADANGSTPSDNPGTTHKRSLSGFEDEISATKANKWELFLAGEYVCPWCSCCTWFVLGWVFFAIFIVKIGSEGTDIFTFEDAVVKSDINVQEYYGYLAAVGTVEGCEDDDHDEERTCNADDNCQWSSALEACEDKPTCEEPDPRPRENTLLYDKSAMYVAIIYEATEDGNLFDDDILRHVKDFEDKLLTDVNGAKSKDGPSPWDEDWCAMAYPNSSATEGKCASVASFMNIFAMTDEGMAAVKSQAAAGYTNVGALSCLCSTQAGLCSICQTDGSAKSVADWPEEVRTCLDQYSGVTTTTTTEPSSSGLPMCEDTSRSFTPDVVEAYATSLCLSQPTCQWSAPGAHAFCTSTAFYHATDISSIVTGDAKTAAIEQLCDDTNTMSASMKQNLIGQSSSCSAKKATFAKTIFTAGSPSAQTDPDEGDNFEKDYISASGGWFQKEQELETQVEDASGGKLRVMLFSSATLQSQFISILLVDMILSLGSLFLVWAYMWWTLESCFLATCAMFEIAFSLPVTMSFWTVICGQQILFTQMLCIYMILGIGADDAFILYDAWLQSSYAADGPSHWTGRFAWAYRRSFSAMQVTTATTCGSFLIGACSPLPQVQNFCIFAAIVVFVDWLFCETFFASAIIIHHRYIKNDQDGQCGGPGCCCGLWKLVSKRFREKRAVQLESPSQANNGDGNGNGIEKRWLERFSEGPLFDHLHKFRFAWIIFWFLLALAMVIVAGVTLRTAEETAPIGREGLDTIRGIEIMLEEFAVGDTRYASVIWGLDADEPMKEWGSSHDDDVANFNPATATAVTTPTGQMEVLNLCRATDLGKNSDALRCKTTECLVMGQATAAQCEGNENAWRQYGVYVPDDVMCNSGRYCFMEEFARYWIYHVDGAACTAASTQLTCPSGCSWDADLSVCYTDKTEHDYEGIPATDFINILGSTEYSSYLATRTEVMSNYGFDFDTYNDATMSNFRMNSAKTALALAWVGFNATYPLQNTVEEANDWYDRWDAFHSKYCPTVGGVQTSELYVFMVTQNAMVQAAIMGIGMSLLISFVVLVLVTWNWWVAGLGLLNIVAITCVFMGIIPIMGWSLGENECIFLIAVVGLSVDYTVHLLHVYHHCPHKTRVARAREALAEMGVSVINSALTTLLAAAILFGCGFYFFFQFGAFIFLVIGFSIVMSITLLIPLLTTIGPQNEQGDLPPLRKQCAKVSPESAAAPARESPQIPKE
mmetsp:Transcript_19436/g.41739  ORF Transcript_19436/g.41739 Transcript_19436/m.41739 type:complete len:1230 (+) Transcript_19436:66-3755(+)